MKNSTSIKDSFVRDIEDKIFSGELSPGDHLPTERELSEKMKISKTAVNSGIAELVRKGFLEVIPRQGTYVADYFKTGSLEVLISLMDFNGGCLDDKTHHSLYETWLAIQSVTSKLAARHRTPEELEQLKAIIAEMENTSDLQKSAELMHDFYGCINLMSKNNIMPLIMHALKKPTMAIANRSLRKNSLDSRIEDLKEIYLSIEMQDEEKTVALINKRAQQLFGEFSEDEMHPRFLK